MTAEHLIDAIGLLDDDLIQEAEQPAPRRTRPNYRQWLGLAASFAVVIALGFGVTRLRTLGESSSNGAAPSCPAGGSMPAQGENSFPSAEGDQWDLVAPGEPGSNGASGGSSPTGVCPAIMVDGVLYWSTGVSIPIEVEESARRTVTGYINTLPETDGQTNFSQDLSAQYAMTDQGLVVLMDGEWVLFDPVPPWER